MCGELTEKAVCNYIGEHQGLIRLIPAEEVTANMFIAFLKSLRIWSTYSPILGKYDDIFKAFFGKYEQEALEKESKMVNHKSTFESTFEPTAPVWKMLRMAAKDGRDITPYIDAFPEKMEISTSVNMLVDNMVDAFCNDYYERCVPLVRRIMKTYQNVAAVASRVFKVEVGHLMVRDGIFPPEAVPESFRKPIITSPEELSRKIMELMGRYQPSA